MTYIKQRKCTRKKDGVECGNTEDLCESRNMCKPCRAEVNREYRANGKKGKSFVWNIEEYRKAAFVNEHMAKWNEIRA